MERAFSPRDSSGSSTWGDAPCWYGVRPLALESQDMSNEKSRLRAVQGLRRLSSSCLAPACPLCCLEKIPPCRTSSSTSPMPSSGRSSASSGCRWRGGGAEAVEESLRRVVRGGHGGRVGTVGGCVVEVIQGRSDDSFSTGIVSPFSAEPQRKDEVAESTHWDFSQTSTLPLRFLSASSAPQRRENAGHDHKLRFFKERGRMKRLGAWKAPPRLPLPFRI